MRKGSLGKTRKKAPVLKRNKSDALNVPKSQYDLLKTILDHVADPIFVKDRNHRIIYGNQALSKIMGMPAVKYLGKSDYDFFPKEEADVFSAKDKHVFETGEVDVNEENLTDSHGNVHIISTKKARCIIKGYEPVIVGIIRDVTEIKEMERLKSDFIAMISHELRTPLTSIHASLLLLGSGQVCALPPKVESMLKIAYKNSERLVRLVNEILDFEKLEVGMMQLQTAPLQLGKFLKQAVEENSAYGKKFDVVIELGSVPPKCRVMADTNRLMQVMSNLLSNAAKFSHGGSRVVVNTRMLPGGRVRIEVRDSGVGIPKKFYSHVFEKFSQSDTSATRRHDGTGLGLTISKKLVELMGGEISFSSKEGQGTSFYIDLLLATPMKATKGAKRYAAGSPKKSGVHSLCR
jgi:PAS domain S-box-containing protein